MDIEYRLDGSPAAPALVLSNSLGTWLDMWHPQISALCEHFFVIRYNQRGHGNTPLGTSSVTLEQLGKDVIELLDHLNIVRAHFCGISMGGITGLWLNRYSPQRVNKLVIANSAACIGNALSWQQRAQKALRDGLQDIAANSSARWFNDEFIQKNPRLLQVMIGRLATSQPEGYAACCLALSTADLRSEVSKMLRPMLIIAGEQDPITTVEESESIHQKAPQAKLLTLATGHLSNLSCPDAFNAAVINFLLEPPLSGHSPHGGLSYRNFPYQQVPYPQHRTT